MKEFTLSAEHNGRNQIDYKNELNKEQFEVVENGDGAVLVLAGAGSGKTRTITYRVAWLLDHGVQPNSILLLTFTNKAARQMVERIENLFGEFPKGLWSGTFHSIANRLLRTYAPYLGYESNFSILDQEDSRDLISICIKELKIDTKNKRFPNARVLQSLISFQRNKAAELDDAISMKHPKFEMIADEIEAVAEMYKKLKKEQNAMDFDDLLLKFLELLRENADVAERLSQQFQYILVDEFQDTNVIQAEIVRRLSKSHKNVLVVGDDAQSIYSFRAADIKNILGFPDRYDDAKTFKLVTNYRSTPQILAVANAVISKNTEQFSKELTAVAESGERPYVVPANSTSQEAQYVAEQILELRENGSPLREIAVLFRAAFHSQSLEFELMRHDIPYDYRGGMKFFERSHVKDIVAHIRLMHNVKDGMAWVRALRIHPGIGIMTANKIAQKMGTLESLSVAGLVKPTGGKRAEAGWAGMIRIVTEMLDAKPMPSHLIRAIAASRDYQAYLEAEFLNFAERLEDLEQFAIFAEQYQDTGSFLEAVSLTDEFAVKREDQQDRNQDKLILSTIHQAKGLEWGTVFVLNLADGSFPHKRSMNEESELEEERRLFYVAVTRARKKLFLSYGMTTGYEHVEIREPSMFLEEIPEKMMEYIKLRRPNSYFDSNKVYNNYGGSSSYGSYRSKTTKKTNHRSGGGVVFKSTAKKKVGGYYEGDSEKGTGGTGSILGNF